jgi:hypothetical protein
VRFVEKDAGAELVSRAISLVRQCFESDASPQFRGQCAGAIGVLRISLGVEVKMPRPGALETAALLAERCEDCLVLMAEEFPDVAAVLRSYTGKEVGEGGGGGGSNEKGGSSSSLSTSASYEARALVGLGLVAVVLVVACLLLVPGAEAHLPPWVRSAKTRLEAVDIRAFVHGPNFSPTVCAVVSLVAGCVLYARALGWVGSSGGGGSGMGREAQTAAFAKFMLAGSTSVGGQATVGAGGKVD